MKAGIIFDFINNVAPFEYQDDWDNAGFLVGDKTSEITKVLLALDATTELVAEAKNLGAELIITHHPVIFHPQKNFLAGNIAFEAVKNNIAVISAHTNYDAAVGGVNDVLASILELQNVRDLFVKEEKQAMLRCGECEAQSAESFANFLYSKFKTPIRYNSSDKQIKRVAICGGAGGMFFNKIMEGKFDAFVTGDADHHEFLDAAAADVLIFAAGHFETEQPAVRSLTQKLTAEFADVEFIVSTQSSPISHYFSN